MTEFEKLLSAANSPIPTIEIDPNALGRKIYNLLVEEVIKKCGEDENKFHRMDFAQVAGAIASGVGAFVNVLAKQAPDQVDELVNATMAEITQSMATVLFLSRKS